MADLKEHFNIYADLAQGAYRGKDIHKMLAASDKKQLKSLEKMAMLNIISMMECSQSISNRI